MGSALQENTITARCSSCECSVLIPVMKSDAALQTEGLMFTADTESFAVVMLPIALISMIAIDNPFSRLRLEIGKLSSKSASRTAMVLSAQSPFDMK